MHSKLVVVWVLGVLTVATIFVIYSCFQESYFISEPVKGDYPLRPERSGNMLNYFTEFDAATAQDDDFMRSQQVLQEDRRNVIAETCRNYQLPQHDILEKPPWNIIVDHSHKLMFCFIPKIACTSWKRVFLVLKGVINNTDEINQFAVNHRLQKYLDFFHRQSRRQKKYILDHYTKFVVARNPMSRVLSAYRNKLAPDTTFSRARRWQKGIGMEIIEHFHPNSNTVYMEEGYMLTFTDFVKFLVAKEEMRKQENRHWNEMFKMCLPCDIKYDIIGKFETMSDDAEFILQMTGISDIVQFPLSNGSSPTNSSDALDPYYAEVPRDDIKRLYERYKLDFELFGYDPPKVTVNHATK